MNKYEDPIYAPYKEDHRRIKNPVKTFKLELFAKLVNGFRPLTIFTKSSNLLFHAVQINGLVCI